MFRVIQPGAPFLQKKSKGIILRQIITIMQNVKRLDTLMMMSKIVYVNVSLLHCLFFCFNLSVVGTIKILERLFWVITILISVIYYRYFRIYNVLRFSMYTFPFTNVYLFYV